MALKIRNNARSTLAVSISATATTLSVSAGTGERFPTIEDDNEWYPVALEDVSGNIEYVRVIDRAGDTLTIQRGQGGSQPRAFGSGSAVELRLTVEAYAAIGQSLGGGASAIITIDDTVIFT